MVNAQLTDTGIAAQSRCSAYVSLQTAVFCLALQPTKYLVFIGLDLHLPCSLPPASASLQEYLSLSSPALFQFLQPSVIAGGLDLCQNTGVSCLTYGIPSSCRQCPQTEADIRLQRLVILLSEVISTLFSGFISATSTVASISAHFGRNIGFLCSTGMSSAFLVSSLAPFFDEKDTTRFSRAAVSSLSQYARMSGLK